jgi:hypothetical protein
MFDLLVGLANGQSIMGDHSQEDQALMKIQHEWAEEPGDLESMTGDIVFSEFKIHNLQACLYGDTGIVLDEGIIKAHKGKQDLLNGKFVWTDTFAKQGGQWKVVASQITPVLEK